MANQEDTRLRKAGRWGLYGGAGGFAVGGALGYAATGLPAVGALSGIHTGIKTGLVGAGLGALLYRSKKKKMQELSSNLDSIINFDYDYSGSAEKLQEHAKKEATKTALDTLYEKILKGGEKPRMRLSARLDDLISLTADPRPRNLQGEFQQQGEGGPDPNAMAIVYKQPQAQSGMTAGGVGKAAGAVFGAGALGAVGAKAGQAGWKKGSQLLKSLVAKRKSMIHKP